MPRGTPNDPIEVGGLADLLGGLLGGGDGADYAELTATRDALRLRAAAAELGRRKCEALHLYEPLPVQAKFHESRTRQRVLRGSNRSGKTLSAAVELARAVTGQDPWMKYPLTDGRAFLVGLDLMHVGQVFYRKLFRAGAFRMLRDAETNKWRAWRPWEPADRERRRETKPAPPLIPQRFVESIAWEEKNKGIPKAVKLTTGWEITFFSSLAKPPQGMDLDYVWFDEEVQDSEWYPEMCARLLDRSGVFVWSATPQAGNDQLLVLSEKADRDRLATEPVVEEFVALLDENPHIDAKEKRQLAALLDDDQAEVRIGGEFAAQRWRVFPEFAPSVHVREVPDVPADWTRYMAVDPGRQVCAVLFAAVPPPGAEVFEVLLYDELYLRACSAATFGEKVAQKVAGQDFEAFYIDGMMGRQTEIGSGVTVEDQYRKALKLNEVASRRTMSGFIHGQADVAAGVEQCRDYLRVNPETEHPRLAVRKDCCPNFAEEIKRYRYKRVGRVITDQPETRGAVHSMAAFRYLCGAGLRWVKPAGKARKGGAYAAFQAKKQRKLQATGGPVIRFGPDRSE